MAIEMSVVALTNNLNAKFHFRCSLIRSSFPFSSFLPFRRAHNVLDDTDIGGLINILWEVETAVEVIQIIITNDLCSVTSPTKWLLPVKVD